MSKDLPFNYVPGVIIDNDNGSYTSQCCLCSRVFAGSKLQSLCNFCIHTNEQTAAPTPEGLRHELTGVITDYENGKTFDEVSLQTIKRVHDELLAAYDHASATTPPAK